MVSFDLFSFNSHCKITHSPSKSPEYLTRWVTAHVPVKAVFLWVSVHQYFTEHCEEKMKPPTRMKENCFSPTSDFHLSSLHLSLWSLHWFAYFYLSLSGSAAPVLLLTTDLTRSHLLFSADTRAPQQLKSNVYWREGSVCVHIYDLLVFCPVGIEQVALFLFFDEQFTVFSWFLSEHERLMIALIFLTLKKNWPTSIQRLSCLSIESKSR